MDFKWSWGVWKSIGDNLYSLDITLDDLWNWINRLPNQAAKDEDYKFLIDILSQESVIIYKEREWTSVYPGVIRLIKSCSIEDSTKIPEASPNGITIPTGNNDLTTVQFNRVLPFIDADWKLERLEDSFMEVYNLFPTDPERATHIAVLKMYKTKTAPYFRDSIPEDTEITPTAELNEDFIHRFLLLQPIYRAALLALIESWYHELEEHRTNLIKVLGTSYDYLVDLALPLWKTLPYKAVADYLNRAPYLLQAYSTWPIPLLWMINRLEPSEVEFLLKACSGKVISFPDISSFTSSQDLETVNQWTLLSYQKMLDEVQTIWEERLKTQKEELTRLPQMISQLNSHSKLLLQLWNLWFKKFNTV